MKKFQVSVKQAILVLVFSLASLKGRVFLENPAALLLFSLMMLLVTVFGLLLSDNSAYTGKQSTKQRT